MVIIASKHCETSNKMEKGRDYPATLLHIHTTLFCNVVETLQYISQISTKHFFFSLLPTLFFIQKAEFSFSFHRIHRD